MWFSSHGNLGSTNSVSPCRENLQNVGVPPFHPLPLLAACSCPCLGFPSRLAVVLKVIALNLPCLWQEFPYAPKRRTSINHLVPVPVCLILLSAVWHPRAGRNPWE